jgi:hypothetical protein
MSYIPISWNLTINNVNYVHIPKTGGTSLRNFLCTCGSNVVTGVPILAPYCIHNLITTTENDSLVVLRQPVDRMISLYKFYKYGRTQPVDSVTSEAPVQFNGRPSRAIDIVQDRSHITFADFTSNIFTSLHLQSTFVPKETWSRVNVIIYDKQNMNEKVNKMMKLLGVETISTLPHLNITNTDIEEVVDTSNLQTFIQNDLDLWNAIIKTPELFKSVI